MRNCSTLYHLLKCNHLKWSPIAQQGFEALKQTMIIALVLALPNFFLPFFLQTNDLGYAMSVVLFKQGIPQLTFAQAFLPARVLGFHLPQGTSGYHFYGQVLATIFTRKILCNSNRSLKFEGTHVPSYGQLWVKYSITCSNHT